MDAGNVLKQVLREILGHKFRPEAIEEQIEMQHTVYLLQGANISVGNYGFMWCQNGLRSQRL